MKQFLMTVAGVLVGLILFLVIAPFALISAISGSSKPVTPASIVLTLDLRESLTDQPDTSAFALGQAVSTVDIVRKLEAAGADRAVKGVLVRANAFGMAPAQAEEIRAALAKFQTSGKFVLAHMQGEGFTTSLAGYAAVAGADELWLQEAADFGAMGLASETTFLGGLLEKFSLQAQFEQREQYKNAVNVYTQKTFTEPHREATAALLEGLYNGFVDLIAADRGLTPDGVRALIAASPYSSKEAVEKGLADKLGRPEDALDAALERAGDGAEPLEFTRYNPAYPASGPVIALIDGEGNIVSGPSEPSLFSDSGVINSDAVAEAFTEAADDKQVKAIIFRVSSLGGSAVASDQIAHAVSKAREAGKPVVVSMGPYATSGGYYVAATADSILAWPTTITGSIGVFGGKLVTGPALERYLGVNTEAITLGSDVVNLTTPDRPFTNAERQAFAEAIDRTYADFKTMVAAGRKLTPAQVDEIAKGRVWTGVQAKERGLVDEFGGLAAAVAKAKELAKIDADTSVHLKPYPAQRSPFEQLQDLFGVSGDAAEGAALLAALAREGEVREAVQALAAARAAKAGVQAREMAIDEVR